MNQLIHQLRIHLIKHLINRTKILNRYLKKEAKLSENAKKLKAEGINLYEWTPEDLAMYRAAVQKGWTEFATTPEAKELLAAHIGFLKKLGAMK